MKKQIFKIAATVLILIGSVNFSLADVPEYKINIGDAIRVAPNAIEFNIHLQHTNSGSSTFEYTLGQYFFQFNPAIANGGELSYRIVGSDLPAAYQPVNPTVTKDQLRLATNAPQALESIPVISEQEPGTLVARMRLETSAKSFSDAELQLRLRTGPENPFTKIAAHVDGKMVDISNKEVVASDVLSGNEVTSELPREFALLQNYPNPFNPSTNIKFDIPKSAKVELTVFDITGRAIATLVNQQMEPGSHSYKFDGSNFASGMYFFRIKASPESGDQFIQTRKMMLIK